MKRKFLSLVLALVMVLGTVSAVFAETTPLTTNESKIQWLVDNKVVVGRTVNKDDTNPDLALEKTITRAEVSKLLVYTLGQQNLAEVLKGAILVFPDVNLDHWANGFVSVLATNRTEVASGRDVVIGYEDGYFRPDKDVTYAELATMLVRIVKKDLTKKMEDEAIWATSYIRWAEELGILEGITLVNSDAPVVRKDAFVMIYNAMHKLGLVGGNRVNWGIKIGIVSKLQAGKIELNQDAEQTYNLTYNTVVTNGTNWNEVNVNTVIPGSLVRLIADENGNVSHLLVVSVPRYTDDAVNNGIYGSYTGFHYVDNNRLFDLGRSVANGYIDFSVDYRPGADVTVLGDTQAKVGVDIELNGSEKVFVADPSNNALREVKSVAEAVEVFAPNDGVVKGFVIYNTHSRYNAEKYNEATVVVFTQVDKYHGSDETLRVRYTPNSLYNVELEDTKGKVVVKNLKEYPFLPVSYYLNQLDVVRLQLPTGNSAAGLPDTRISSASAPVLKVTGIAGRTLTLEDAAGRYTTADMTPKTKVFLEGQLVVGALVQLDKEATRDDVKIVSVVTNMFSGPRGKLPFKNPLDKGMHRGFITEMSDVDSPAQGAFLIVTFGKKDGDGNIDNTTLKTVAIPKGTKVYPDNVVGLTEGKEYEFYVSEPYNHELGQPIVNRVLDLKRMAYVNVNKDLKVVDPTKAIADEADFKDRHDAIVEIIKGYEKLNDNAKDYLDPNQVEARAKINAEIDVLNAYLAANGPITGYEALDHVK